MSRAPMHEHTRIVEAIGLPFRGSRFNEPAFPWHCAQGGGLNLVGIEDGYVPDLIILDSLLDSQVSGDHMPVPDQVELVVEVTSASNADIDRRPVEGEARRNKWWGYAKVGIPYYLLVDRSPKLARSTLYSIPDEAAGAYLQEESWAFGEAIVLPEHFGLTIPTDEWTAWEPR